MFRRSYKAPCVRLVVKARAWQRISMRLLKWSKKMPSTNQYDLVPNDEYDTRIPLHPDEAFQYGLSFQAKYIGTMDVPRPTNRVEIVAAMRRVRYEFKAKGVKKRKVTFDVSTNGVRVTTRKKKSKCKKNPGSKLFGRSNKNAAAEGQEIMHHPIYRIFYVSHDSSDLKIFSYIARDGATNVFKCNVFKSNRKSQAMRIVRTVGQAFEVCHKMQGSGGSDQPAPSTSSADDALTDRGSALQQPKVIKPTEGASDCGASESGAASTSKAAAEEPAEEPRVPEEQARPKHLELLPPPPRKEGKKSPQLQRTNPAPSIRLGVELPECVTRAEAPVADAGAPLSAQHQVQLLRERLEQQAQQTQAAVAQLLLLRDQLAAEQAARCEAQARTHQLLVHNKELLEHIAALVAHLQERERGSSRPISAQQLTLLPQNKEDVRAHSPGKTEPPASLNGNPLDLDSDTLINLLSQSSKSSPNAENNNIRLSPFSLSPAAPGTPTAAPSFGAMTNDQIQNYLISKFQNIDFADKKTEANTKPQINLNQQYFQNCNAFPSIPPITNHYSNTNVPGFVNHQAYLEQNGPVDDLRNLTLPMSVGHSQSSLCSNSQATTSKDSSPEAFSSDDVLPFIMPLSHNGTLTATSEDGRVRLIVPVSPSPSASDMAGAAQAQPVGSPRLLTPAGPILRTTSEKVPNRSEMMTALRSQWTRHTTK